jgi:hypothetical protein
MISLLSPMPSELIKIELAAGDFSVKVKSPTFEFLRREFTAEGVARCDLLLELVEGWEGVRTAEGDVPFTRRNLETLCEAYPAAYGQLVLKLSAHLRQHRLSETEQKN